MRDYLPTRCRVMFSFCLGSFMFRFVNVPEGHAIRVRSVARRRAATNPVEPQITGMWFFKSVLAAISGYSYLCNPCNLWWSEAFQLSPFNCLSPPKT